MGASELWPYRWLFINFLTREINGRYVGSISGLFWAILHPLALLGVYAAVFITIFKVKFPELAGHSFTVFVAVALWPWLCFQEGVQRGTLAVQNSSGLIKKVAFPHELLVYGAVIATYLIHLTGFVLVLAILAFVGNPLHFGDIPLILALLSIQLIFTAGLSLLLAATQILLKDVEHFLAPIFMVWFYATPILYPATQLPKEFQQVMAWNPLSYFVTRIRELLMFGGGRVEWQDLTMLAVAVLTFLAGRWYFRRLSPYFEDFV